MYDPTVGKWITEDPIGFESGDVNLYRYVGNEPITTADPSGLQSGTWPSSPDRPLPVVPHLGKSMSTTAVRAHIQRVMDENRNSQESPQILPIHVIARGEAIVPSAPAEVQIGYDSISDLVKQLKARAEKREGTNCRIARIAVLELYSHASPFSFGLPGEDTKLSMNSQNASSIGQQLRASGVLAPNCLIILEGCNSGLGRGPGTYPQLLASGSGCDVIAAGGYLEPKVVADLYTGNIPVTKKRPKDFKGEYTSYYDYVSNWFPREQGRTMIAETVNSKDDTWYMFPSTR